MAYNFNGKVAIVTGSSNGIGRATAILFAEAGAAVCIHGRSSDALQETKRLCLEANGKNEGKILEILGDLTDDELAKKLIQDTVNKFGRLDILINNAGGCQTSFDEDEIQSNIEHFDYTMKLNVRSILQLSQLAFPYLKETKGEIVNVSSIAGLNFAAPHYSYYGISKGSQDQLTRNLAANFIRYGVRVNGVNPGIISTHIIQSRGFPDELVTKIEKAISSEPRRVPIGRAGTSPEVAQSILFLADRTKSEYIVGHMLRIDGGSSLHNPFLAEGYKPFAPKE